MTRLAPLAATEARLLARDWTVVVFAFVFPPFVTLILAGVFGTQPDDGFGMKRPDDYYVAASIGIPMIALALVGLPVALASYRERGVLRRLEAFGVSAGRVVAAQAIVTCGLILLSAGLSLAVAARRTASHISCIRGRRCSEPRRAHSHLSCSASPSVWSCRPHEPRRRSAS